MGWKREKYKCGFRFMREGGKRKQIPQTILSARREHFWAMTKEPMKGAASHEMGTTGRRVNRMQNAIDIVTTLISFHNVFV